MSNTSTYASSSAAGSSLTDNAELQANPITVLKKIQNGTAYMYEASKQNEFLEWWEKTPWAQKMLENIFQLENSTRQGKFLDPRWGSANRTAKQWSSYGQGALVRDGKPFVYCLTCNAVLQHPRAFGVGTFHMISHLKSSKCMKASSRPRETVHAMLSKVPIL